MRVRQNALEWLARAAGRPTVLRRAAPPEVAELFAPASTRPNLDDIVGEIVEGVRSRSGALMNAYVSSAVEVALEAEALADGAQASRVRTPVHELVAEVVAGLQPFAEGAGVALTYDRDSRWSCVATTDPRRLGKALSHLALRALATPGAAGAVRIMVSADPEAIRISVLAVGMRADPGLADLGALVRLLQGLGAFLVAESQRAGCAPLSIVLPNPTAAPAQAAQEVAR